MITLAKIKDDSCPDCGCRKITSESSSHQHCNGDWNEHRVFDCGKNLHYSPNFSQVREESPCTKSAAYLKQRADRQAAVHKIKVLIGNLAVDDKFRTQLLSRLPDPQYV